MRNSLHNDEFEHFLQEQADNHRMYPADKIWRNIQKEIHGEGRWPALTYISIGIITALVISTLMVKPEERLQKNTIAYPAHIEEVTYNGTKLQQGNTAEAAAPVQYAYTNKITQQTLQSVNEVLIAREEKQNHLQQLQITKQSLLSVQDKKISPAVNISPETIVVKAAAKQPSPTENNTIAKENNIVDVNVLSATAKPVSRYFSTLGLLNPADLKKTSDNVKSSYNDDMWRTYALLTAQDLLRKKLSKLSFQFYITPSVSYRRLNDAHGKTAASYTALPVATNYRFDINRVVEHRPAMGAEVGFALGYQLSNTLTVKGGFQFNIRQYGIKAYTISQPNLSDASPVGNAIGTSQPDEHADNSYLASADNSSDANQSVVLNNRYYELSAPIGIDWRILSSNDGKLSVNTAFALQPTYTFDKEPFVLTTNYKSYTDGTSLMRNWNLNSNVEAYISYKIGPFRWQLGPQFRFQHFSTYSNAYPVREHLLDYGIKLGFTKSLD